MLRATSIVLFLLVFAGSGVAQAPAPKPYGNLAQVMRGMIFPHANTIFDTQTEDPAVIKKPKMPGDSATARFGDLYGGWVGVESAAVALSEAANLLMIPGRLCMNGKPVPLNQPDWAKFVQQLRDSGTDALKAAQSKNMDDMLEVSGTVTEACSGCHEVYRDTPRLEDRCTPSVKK